MFFISGAPTGASAGVVAGDGVVQLAIILCYLYQITLFLASMQISDREVQEKVSG
jgi:hypothetical protein